MAVIAVDCGGTSLKFGRVADPGRPPPTVATVPTPATAESIPATIVAAVGDLVEPGVTGIGIGVAGLVDAEGGELVWMPHRPGGRVPIREAVSRRLGIPAAVDNDANLAAYAEARAGAGAGRRMVLAVIIGTGIGVGLVIQGRIERGRAHLGEAGHVVIDPAGPPCPCGKRGCWEAYVSGGALRRMAGRRVAEDPAGAVARAAGGSRPAGEHLVQAARWGDETARADLALAGRDLGRGIAALIMVLDPDVVVIGGGAAQAGDLLLEPARAAVAETVAGRQHRADTPLVAAAFGAQSGLVGAGMIGAGPG